jgi:hypothetical protein
MVNKDDDNQIGKKKKMLKIFWKYNKQHLIDLL